MTMERERVGLKQMVRQSGQRESDSRDCSRQRYERSLVKRPLLLDFYDILPFERLFSRADRN